jgi:hypothetical protein
MQWCCRGCHPGRVWRWCQRRVAKQHNNSTNDYDYAESFLRPDAGARTSSGCRGPNRRRRPGTFCARTGKRTRRLYCRPQLRLCSAPLRSPAASGGPPSPSTSRWPALSGCRPWSSRRRLGSRSPTILSAAIEPNIIRDEAFDPPITMPSIMSTG